MVPAHTGGADLSVAVFASFFADTVPAHTGGADLSPTSVYYFNLWGIVPAHTGGADLSYSSPGLW